MDVKKTSIIILAYHELEKFERMFKILLQHTHQNKTPYEIIIVNNSDLPECQYNCDDNSPSFIDDMQALAFKQGVNCSIYESGENLGTSKGFNIGAKLAIGHYLCFFNSDYYMIDNWLESMIKCFNHKKNIGVISCATNVSGNIDEKFDGEYMMVPNDYKESECALAQMFTTKKIWEEVKGFNENLYPVTFEDLDFSEKIKKAGYKIFVNRKTWGFHDHNDKNEIIRKDDMKKNRAEFKKLWGDKYPWA